MKKTKPQTNKRKQTKRTQLRSIANAVNATPVVRNMMPKTSTFMKKIDWPLYIFLKTNRKLALTTEVTGGTEIDMPAGGLEFTQAPEYMALSYEVDTLRLVSLGASVNFIQNESITLVNIFEKWMYGESPEQQLCKVDSTYQPLEWDNKLRQNYKTYIPNQTAGYLTYYSYNAFTEILRKINYQIFGESPTIPAANTLVGTITLAMWVQCKRKQTPFISELNSTKLENTRLVGEVKELQDKLDKFKRCLDNKGASL